MEKHWGLRMNLKENESKRKSIMDRKRRERKRAGRKKGIEKEHEERLRSENESKREWINP